MENVTPIRQPFDLAWVDKVIETYNQDSFVVDTAFSEDSKKVFMPIPMERATSLAIRELSISQIDSRLWTILNVAAKMCIGEGYDYDEIHAKRMRLATRASQLLSDLDIDPTE